MERWPTRNGISVPPYDLWLPEGKEKRHNNHHGHWTARQFGRTAVTDCLRNLERHQYLMPIDQHNFIHDTYKPPKLPTEEQAAMEIIDAYENGENLKIYNKQIHAYEVFPIEEDTVNRFMAKYGIRLCFLGAAD